MTKEEFRESIIEVTLPSFDSIFTYFICERYMKDVSKTIIKFVIGDVRLIKPSIIHTEIDAFDKDFNIVKSENGYLASVFNKVDINRTWFDSTGKTSFGLPLEKSLSNNPGLYHSKKETLKIYNNIEIAKEALIETFFSRNFLAILKHK